MSLRTISSTRRTSSRSLAHRRCHHHALSSHLLYLTHCPNERVRRFTKSMYRYAMKSLMGVLLGSTVSVVLAQTSRYPPVYAMDVDGGRTEASQAVPPPGAATNRSCVITAFGAVAGNRSSDARRNAAALQAALARCERVVVPPGGNMELHGPSQCANCVVQATLKL